MSSDADICNVALENVDRKRITSLTQGTPSANACNAIFEQTRDDLMRNHDWNFARARAKLAQQTAAPEYEFDYAYSLPSDWLATRAVHDNESGIGAVQYKIEGLTILSNATDIYLTYTKKVTDGALMSPDFRTWLAYRLAMQLAKNSSIRDDMTVQAEKYQRRAKSTDAVEDDGAGLEAGAWCTARGR